MWLQYHVIKVTVASSLRSLESLTLGRPAAMLRKHVVGELRTPVSSCVREPLGQQVPQPQSSLQMVEALADNLRAAS